MARRHHRPGDNRESARMTALAIALSLVLLMAIGRSGYAQSREARDYSGDGTGSALIPAPPTDLATPPPDDGDPPPPPPAYGGDLPAAAGVPAASKPSVTPIATGAGSSIVVTLTGGPSDGSSADNPSRDDAAIHSHWARVRAGDAGDLSDSGGADSSPDQVLELPQVVDTNSPPSVQNPPDQTASAGQGGPADGANPEDQIGGLEDYQDQVDMAGMYPVPMPMGPVMLNPMMAQRFAAAPYGYPAFPRPPIGGVLPQPQFGAQLPPGPYIVPPGMNTMRSAILSNSPMLSGPRGGFGRPGGFRMGMH